MKVLILGGTKFLGRHLVESLKKDKDIEFDITLFNRGQTNANLFKKVNYIKGDRFKDIVKIHESYDVIIDTNGYFPRNMDELCSKLKDKTKKFIFISSCSVYDLEEQPQENVTELKHKLVNIDIDESDETNETYGARKYLCEKKVEAHFPRSSLILRPGLIVGPHDSTYRFPYWGDRIAKGGKILAPGDPKAPVQFIDARDLSDFIVQGIKYDLVGVFNTVSPYNELNLEEFLLKGINALNSDGKLQWINEKILRDNDIGCWVQIPLWVYSEIQAFQKMDSQKAILNGLKFRPIEQTIIDTYNWSKDISDQSFKSGALTSKLEASLLSL
mgnify:CR=1 FL=1